MQTLNNLTPRTADKKASTTQENEISPAQQFMTFNVDKLIIGLTGGIGSGKTAVSNWFAEQGITIVDADVIAHDIMQKDSPTLQKLADALGTWVIDKSGNMDRNAVREHVFTNNQALLTLESITHPAIRQEIKKQLIAAKSHYIILAAPLLLESTEGGLVSLCDRVLVVDTPESTQLQRASARDDKSIEQIKTIMDNQLSREARREKADDIVINDGTLEELYTKLAPLHEKYLTLNDDMRGDNISF